MMKFFLHVCACCKKILSFQIDFLKQNHLKYCVLKRRVTKKINFSLKYLYIVEMKGDEKIDKIK